jgi:hypothetical protein
MRMQSTGCAVSAFAVTAGRHPSTSAVARVVTQQTALTTTQSGVNTSTEKVNVRPSPG